MKTNKIKIGVEKHSRSGLVVSDFDRSVFLKKGMRVSIVNTTTTGWVLDISGDAVTLKSDVGTKLVENAKMLRAVL